ncbi:Uncharacterised protein [Legionella pneumophila]|nr:Uncharacterised protein [Legionella pneumophila]
MVGFDYSKYEIREYNFISFMPEMASGLITFNVSYV